MSKKEKIKKIPTRSAETSLTQPTPASAKPEFAAKLDSLSQQPAAADAGGDKPDGRGGARPGAGRPKGVTDDLALVNRLPDVANKTLIPIIQIPFELWSISTKQPKLALTKEEGEELALPVTQLLEFYFPGKIPEIAFVWLCLLGSTYNVMKPRLTLLAELRGQKKQAVSGSASAAETPSNSSTPSQAGPVSDYPKAK